MSLVDFDYVMHAASIASPSVYRRHPIATMDANVHGLAARCSSGAGSSSDRGHARRGFLFFSSSEIYGDPEPAAIPTPETYPGRVSSTGPRACYDESKRFGETLCVNFAQQYELAGDDRSTLQQLRARIENHRPAGHTRFGPRSFRRSRHGLVFGRVGHADVLLCRRRGYRLFKALVHGRRGEAYNIGCDSPEITIDELASRISAIAGPPLSGIPGV